MGKNNQFEVAIIGGGVSGTALAYILNQYTNIKSIKLFEKEKELASINSHKNNNSQTLHFGDIETNYNLQKAQNVKRAADLVKNFVLKYDKEKKTYSKYNKMVLAVGDEQVEKLKKRALEFKKLFSKNKIINREEIKKIEPKTVEGRNEKEKILAYFSEDGYTMDYQELSKLFIEKSNNVEVELNKKVKNIKKNEENFEILFDDGKMVSSKVVVVAAGAHSLLFAKEMGYGKDLALFSIAGCFYFVPKSLTGKVYTMQREKLPFAAIHGDPDVHESTQTRFGPTAKAVLLLERHKYKTFWQYLKTTGFQWKTIISFLNINSDPIILRYILKNLLYDLPFLGKRLFLKEVKKIVPKTTIKELIYAKGYGGVRPQIVNNKTHTLDMGEAKIIENKIIFNITPSPGASTCLSNAEKDAEKIVDFLGKGYSFDKKKFEKDFVCGPECGEEEEGNESRTISKDTVLSFG